MEELTPYKIIDITVGDSHCLALTSSYKVFAWGLNNLGQCGHNNNFTVVLKPTEIIELRNANIRQISAGSLMKYLVFEYLLSNF